MITTLSWRRADCRDLDEDGSRRAQPLLATDAGSMTVLHLRAGAATDPVSHPVGQLVLVMAGTLEVEIGDERAEVLTGEAVRLPAGREHRLSSQDGITAAVMTYPESDASWRVSRMGPQGERWVAGVFSDTDRARGYRDRLREQLGDAETIAMD